MHGAVATSHLEDIEVTGTGVGRSRVVFHYSDLDETGLVREDDRLHTVAQVEFLEDASDVGFTVPSLTTSSAAISAFGARRALEAA